MLIKLPEITEGYNPITEMDGVGKEMLMDIGVQKISAGNSVDFFDEEKETAFLLLDGEVTFKYDDKETTAKRTSLLDEGCTVLHVCKGTKVTVEALSDVEVQVQKTTNDREFPAKFYLPEVSDAVVNQLANEE